jgi:hypothetical protein
VADAVEAGFASKRTGIILAGLVEEDRVDDEIKTIDKEKELVTPPITE